MMRRSPTPLAGNVVQWLRPRLFATWSSALATLTIVCLAWNVVPGFLDWAVLDAVWSPADAQLCRQMQGEGACWAFVADKYRFILFGTYP